MSWHVLGGTSDNAAAVLAGRDMVHGNLLLHGWHLGADSFFLLDLPVLGLQTSASGLGPATFHVVPTGIAAATVLITTVSASRLVKRRDAAIAALATFLILAFPSAVFAAFFLQGPIHVSTTLVCVGSFVLLTPGGGSRRWAFGTMLLLAAVASDPLALAIGAVPLMVAGAAVSRTQDLREGIRVIVAAIVAVVGGELLARTVAAVGGFQRLPSLRLAAASQWPSNLRLGLHDFVYIFGVRVPPGWPHIAAVVRLTHLVGLTVVALAVVDAVVGLIRRLVVGRGHGTWVDDLCVAALGGSIAVYVVVIFPGENVSRTRYLLPAMVCGAILGGRFASRHLGRMLDRSLATRNQRRRRLLPIGVLATAVLVLVGAGNVAGSIASARTTTLPTPPVVLAAWLSAHHLTHGWGGYWDATVVTVVSNDQVRVVPVIGVHGQLHGFADLASDAWFTDHSGAPQSTFLVYEPRSPWGDVTLATATATFGKPDEQTVVSIFKILVWNHDTRTLLLPAVTS